MILSLCDDPDVLSVFRMVRIIINIIKIVVPIILIVSGMITFVRAVNNGDNGKALNSLKNKAIAAILIFLIPTIVITIVDATEFDKENLITCFKLGTDEGVNAAANIRAEEYVITAKTTLNTGYYTMAKTYVNNLEDTSAKNSYLAELEKVKADLDEAQKERERRKKEAEKKGAIGGSVTGDGSIWSPSKYTEGGTAGGGVNINPTGDYSKSEIMDMDEQTVRNMSNEEFIKFIAAAARFVYAEEGGVLPSITIAQACLESGYGDHFEATSHNVYGLIGYPGNKPKVNRLRKFDNFYEATYYHATYFPAHPKFYTEFLNYCKDHDVGSATPYLKAYAGGSTTYGPTVQQLINQYNLTQYDY